MLTDTWTQERIETLTTLVAAKMSAGQIANEMGLTRNSVISKVFRTSGLKLAGAVKSGPRGPRKPAGEAKARPQPLRLLPPARPADIMKAVAVAPLRIGFMALRQHQCRYVVGRGEDGLAVYCGRPTQIGFAWCQGHRLLCEAAPK